MIKLFTTLFFSAFLMSGSFAQTCPPADVPDPLFQDNNGDGIDGDSTHAIFVTPTGNDTWPGTKHQPVKTIETGIQKAKAQGKDVYVSKGTYTLTSPLDIAPGVNMYGLFNSATNWSRSNADTTKIIGKQTAVLCDSIFAETHIEGFEIHSAAGVTLGESSYAIRINGSPGKTVIRFNTLMPGVGANGTAGNNGLSGVNGSNGANGGGGSCDGSQYGAGGVGGASSCGKTGGTGGHGGPEGNNSGENGYQGITGTPGGNGGSGGDPGGTGQNGQPGANGINGTNGTAASATGYANINGFVPSSGVNGTIGTSGNGGGGGGGGGGQGCLFCNDGSGNGGGGGGGGGCFATEAGGAGIGAGGSFGVFVYNSTAVIDRNNIITSQGGTGGKGGNGALGGSGGTGGIGGSVCTGEVGRGGNGGSGGNGGASGAGSGGAGGPSIGIYMAAGSAAVQSDTNYYIIANGGTGGLGGTNTAIGNAPNGPAGTSAMVYGTTSGIPVLTPNICVNDVSIPEPTTVTDNAVFKIQLSSPAQQTITVHYQTSDGTATAGSDYTYTAGNLTFIVDQIYHQVNVPVLSDAVADGNETFNLNLTLPVNAAISDGTGICTITSTSGIDEPDNGIPNSYQLLQNIPNPFSNETEIVFGLPGSKEINLSIYSLSGQLVTTLVSEKRSAGWYHEKFNCYDVSPGIYVYRLATDDAILFKKMSVVR